MQIIQTNHRLSLNKPTNMFAAIKYSSDVTTTKKKLNPFSPGMTNVNDIPEKNRIVKVASTRNVFRDFPTCS